jgi:Spy/CpxP family protein refolding chaperone
VVINRGGFFGGQADQMAKVCELSEDQVKKIAEINQAAQKAAQEAQAANADKMKELMAKLREAQSKQDAEGLNAARQEMSALQKPQMEAFQKAQADIQAVLTPEQKAKWTAYQIQQSVTMQLWGIKLTDDQTAKVKDLVAEAIKVATADEIAARGKLVAAVVEMAKKEVLTDEQRDTLAKRMAGWGGGALRVGAAAPGAANPGQPAAGGAAPVAPAGEGPSVIIIKEGGQTANPYQPAP